MIEDLSTRHQPITSLFDPPNSREELAAFRLSDDQVAFYKEHGYVAGIRVLSHEQVEVLREQLAALTDPSQETNHLFYEYTRWARGGSLRRFTICCGTRRSPCLRRSCLKGRSVSGTISSSASHRFMVGA